MYYFMHGNERCGEVSFDEISGRVSSYKDYRKGSSPFLGNFDSDKMKKWWEMRAVPASRNMMQAVLRKTGCVNTETYLVKNLALSMTDAYWVCPEGIDIKYEQVELRNIYGKLPYHNVSSYDPNASLGGQMEKYWELDTPTPVLVKESYKYFGQQSVNEVFATHIHQAQDNGIPFVEYHAEVTEDRGILCKCPAFTTRQMELVPAYEVVESEKKRNEDSVLDSYIKICKKHGIDVQEFMDYLILSDFVISNTDEHLLNFGVLRDINTLQIVAPAPIFDSGNSMFYSENRRVPYTRAELLQRPITSFYKREDKMLAKVKDTGILRVDMLPDKQEVKEFYASAGIPEWKADVISENYDTKKRMLNELQHGMKISLYNELKVEKTIPENSFIMLCGIPGSGKTDKAYSLCETFGKKIESRLFYTLDEAKRDSTPFMNKQAALDNLKPIPGCKNAVTVISANEIRSELESTGLNHDFVFLLADARMKRAVMSGVNVIFDATNLDRSRREYYMDLVGNDAKKQIFVMDILPGESKSDIPIERLESLYAGFQHPEKSEGWDEIIICKPTRLRERDEEMER